METFITHYCLDVSFVFQELACLIWWPADQSLLKSFFGKAGSSCHKEDMTLLF